MNAILKLVILASAALAVAAPGAESRSPGYRSLSWLLGFYSSRGRSRLFGVRTGLFRVKNGHASHYLTEMSATAKANATAVTRHLRYATATSG